MKKLIFKVDKDTMGDFSYVGFRKYVGENIAMGTDIYGNYILIKPNEYMELGFGSKPDIKNWKNEIGKDEFEKDDKGTLLGCGEYKDIKVFLKAQANFKPVKK